MTPRSQLYHAFVLFARPSVPRSITLVGIIVIFSFSILLIIPPVASHVGDRAGLLSFKSGVWGNLSDWGSPNVCDWTGITCDPHNGRVTYILLSNSNLTGVISPAIGNLSMLERLELHRNYLSGSIPPELGMLSQLKELSLHDNHLNGTIPKALGLLKNMTYLTLDDNNLVGEIPEAIFCNCSFLTCISMSNNSLTGKIPFPTRCRLPALTELNLWGNGLVGGIPQSVSNCTKLQQVLLSDNNLGGVLPPQMFNKMPNLTFLHLSNNSFSSDDGNTNLEPFLASLVNCTSLQELGVSLNGIGGEIPTIIGNLSANLTLLFLNDNNIYGTIPPAIGNLVKLTQLCLKNNLLEGPIPSEILHLRELQLLDLSNNRITGEIPESIGTIQQLDIINISHNRLQGTIPMSLSNLRLDHLILHHNNLSGAIPPGLRCSLTLDLSHNKLTGQIPAEMATQSSFNIYLNLSNNLLEGTLPLQIGYMEKTQSLDFSMNKLTGVIPMQIGRYTALEYVNLSKNGLRGSLPTSIGIMPNLHVLDVSFNSLTGVLPRSLQASPALRYANFSYNNFAGEVFGERAFANLTDDSFLGNPGLCGSISGMVRCNATHVCLRRIVIIAIIVAIIAGVLTIVCVNIDRQMIKRRLKLTAPISQPSRFLAGSVNATGEEREGDHPRISYRELVDATDSFSEVNLIGKGGYGHVYKGVLHGGVAIAVKVMRRDYYSGREAIVGSFERECRVLRSIRHRNLIRVITACSTPDFKAVVLPFMPNGSLEGLIHHPPHPRAAVTVGKAPAAKQQRVGLALLLGIAGNVADGMAYLHHHAPFKVVHCDLKPSNVLLDDDMTAVVSDFGISKLMNGAKHRAEISDGDGDADAETSTPSPCNSITRLLQGSVGYIAPEYGLGGHPSTQGDVYSYGVMLLELISGKRPTDVIAEEGHSLHEWVKNRCLHGDVGAVVERSPLRGPPSWTPLISGGRPRGETLGMDVVVELLELGIACSQLASSMRPSMDDVAHEIACLRDGSWRKYRPEDLKANDQRRCQKY